MRFDYNLQPGRVRNSNKTDISGKPLVSIITGFYNAGTYFEQTFNSVMNQTFPWFEWIIVNDGSTNETDIGLLNQLAQTDRRVKIINQENGGLSYARNIAIQNSVTEIIIPLDSDDLLAPSYVEYVFWGLYYNEDAAWCYTCNVGFHSQEYLWNYPWDAEKLKTYNFLTVTAAIRKKDIEEIGGYKVEEFSYFEDWRFWLEMLSKGKKPVSLGGYLYWYRRLGNGMLSTIRRNPAQEQLANNIIKEAAKKADGTVKAKEYPLSVTEHPYYQPKIIDLGNEYVITNGRIHILMIIPWMTVGGSDKFNLDFVKKIDKGKFDISVITTMQSENDWQQKFECYTDKIFNLPDFLDPAYYIEFVGYYIKAKSVSIVFVTNSYIGYDMIPWIRKNFPQIGIIDYVHMEEWYWRGGGYARISGVMGELIDKTYVCNRATRRIMLERFNRKEDSVKTVYIGVDETAFNRDMAAPGYLYHNYHIPDNKKIILFPCRIHPQKRPFMMLDIARSVHARNKDALFVVVGDGSQLEELKSTIECRGLGKAVICIGYSDNMVSCYRDACLTLICSLKEGLSLTAYESCAMGVPVVSSDVGGQGDLIDHTVGALIPMVQDEEHSLDSREFDQNEIQMFADAILELLENTDRYQDCSRNCRKKIEEYFSTQKMIENMECELMNVFMSSTIKEKHERQCREMNGYGAFADEAYTLQCLLEREEREIQQLRDELWAIKSMRLWQFMKAYCYMVNENKVGKRVYRILRKWFGREKAGKEKGK